MRDLERDRRGEDLPIGLLSGTARRRPMRGIGDRGCCRLWAPPA